METTNANGLLCWGRGLRLGSKGRVLCADWAVLCVWWWRWCQQLLLAGSFQGS
jgi:hypothetical protein